MNNTRNKQTYNYMTLANPYAENKPGFEKLTYASYRGKKYLASRIAAHTYILFFISPKERHNKRLEQKLEKLRIDIAQDMDERIDKLEVKQVGTCK